MQLKVNVLDVLIIKIVHEAKIKIKLRALSDIYRAYLFVFKNVCKRIIRNIRRACARGFCKLCIVEIDGWVIIDTLAKQTTPGKISANLRVFIEKFLAFKNTASNYTKLGASCDYLARQWVKTAAIRARDVKILFFKFCNSCCWQRFPVTDLNSFLNGTFDFNLQKY